jgi:hypothetical protein
MTPIGEIARVETTSTPGAVMVGRSSHVHVCPSIVTWPPPPGVPREEKSAVVARTADR